MRLDEHTDSSDTNVLVSCRPTTWRKYILWGLAFALICLRVCVRGKHAAHLVSGIWHPRGKVYVAAYHHVGNPVLSVRHSTIQDHSRWHVSMTCGPIHGTGKLHLLALGPLAQRHVECSAHDGGKACVRGDVGCALWLMIPTTQSEGTARLTPINQQAFGGRRNI